MPAPARGNFHIHDRVRKVGNLASDLFNRTRGTSGGKVQAASAAAGKKACMNNLPLTDRICL